MTDSFREWGGKEGLSKRWTAGSIQEPLLILPGIPPLQPAEQMSMAEAMTNREAVSINVTLH